MTGLGWLYDLWVVLTDPILVFLEVAIALLSILFYFLHKLKTTHENESSKRINSGGSAHGPNLRIF
ncbi:hypothetical protein GCM10028803_53480 [Larkinella knui]